MKEQIKNLVDAHIEDLQVEVYDAFYEEVEGKKVFNIVLDTKEGLDVIDLNRVTDASRIINDIIDKEDIVNDMDELDIYSRQKGDDNYE